VWAGGWLSDSQEEAKAARYQEGTLNFKTGPGYIAGVIPTRLVIHPELRLDLVLVLDGRHGGGVPADEVRARVARCGAWRSEMPSFGKAPATETED